MAEVDWVKPPNPLSPPGMDDGLIHHFNYAGPANLLPLEVCYAAPGELPLKWSMPREGSLPWGCANWPWHSPLLIREPKEACKGGYLASGLGGSLAGARQRVYLYIINLGMTVNCSQLEGLAAMW